MGCNIKIIWSLQLGSVAGKDVTQCDKYSNIQKKIKQSLDFQEFRPGGGVEAGAEFAADAVGIVAGALGGEP